jgi:ABC-type molybdenum transport system ATPase subunit/photorepair protein PhrA
VTEILAINLSRHSSELFKRFIFLWKDCYLIGMNILEVKGLSVKVEGKLILKDVTFSLQIHESHILFGPNGSGKTSFSWALTSPTRALKNVHSSAWW